MSFAIRAEEIGKQFTIGEEQVPYKRFTEVLSGVFRRKPGRPAGERHVWALRGLSFEIPAGSAVGVIGRNGAGKSTLLKILSRITPPTEGWVEIHGRVASLLEVGTGFHPELTGRENIYLNGAILGMRRVEINEQFDKIVEFSEVRKFLDTPVKHYSSGMYLRLAFAVAAHLQPEILLIDEVLAVGDVAFQRKCIGKMSDVAQQGKTVLFVSHDLSAVSRLTNESVVLDQGRVVFHGATEDAIKKYMQLQQSTPQSLQTRVDRRGDGLIRVTALRFETDDGSKAERIQAGQSISIVVEYKTDEKDLSCDAVQLDVTLRDSLSKPVVTFSTRFGGRNLPKVLPPSGSLRCKVGRFDFTDDAYQLDVWLAYRNGLADWLSAAAQIEVLRTDFYGTGHMPVCRKHGSALVAHEWELL